MAMVHLLVTRRFIWCASVIGAVGAVAVTASAGQHGNHGHGQSVQLGPRPFYLVDSLEPGPLKTELEQCSNGPFRRSDFSIGRRGAALQFPEHSREAYLAGARMGASILECDVTFTPADPAAGTPANAQCCTSFPTGQRP